MKDRIRQVKLATLATQRYSWEHGTVAQAFLEQGERNVVIAMAREAAYRQEADGRAAMIGGQAAVTDPCSPGEALIYAYEETGDDYFKESYEKLLHWAMVDAPRNGDGIVYHLDNAPEIWVDSFYMLPPFLARAGKYDEAMRQIRGYWNILFRPEKKLLAHMWQDEEKRFLREDVWGVGNGWAMAGMTRVLRLLPAEYAAEKAELAEKINILLAGALALVRADGLFHDVPDRPDTFVETNFSQMVAYTIYRGVKGGWVDADLLPMADKMRDAAWSKLDDYGMVQGVCGAPTFDKPGTAPEGQAFFLLMEAAKKDMD
ncbi:MAG: glycoside hydrolase family 88 protein [Clostridia bacterium]|nr:glycoside hydrolase family 88 protein [Clostridia bacterium]MBQ4625253.1 glycoside hydrolase family 88 protein [Clostridia bacterium]